ncbi:MAG: GH116 family glycosyl-hydrolase, partial [Anaerolineales bacterium]
MPAQLSAGQLFPRNLLHASWQRFEAAGYSQPVTGVVYRGDPRPTCGLPLGGLDTGCVDIESNGLLGYSTLFNHLAGPRLLLNLPFLGLHSGGQTHVLVSDRLGKRDAPRPALQPISFPPTDYTPLYDDIGLEGVEIAASIDYWGHYPVLDLAYTTAAPVEVSLRAWSPFMPGDVAASMTPGAVFDVLLHNPGAERQGGTLAFNWPGFETRPGGAPAVTRGPLENELNGVMVHSGQHGDAWEMAYVLAASGEAGAAVRTGGPLNADGAAWSRIAQQLPPAGAGETGSSLAVDFHLAPGEHKSVRLVLAWHAPHWRAGGAPSAENTHLYTHMYARHHPDALTTAQHLARSGDDLLRRVIAWQAAIYQDPHVPGWLADALINNLYLFPETSAWGQATAPLGEWCRAEDGLYAMNECPRGCPQFECIPCSFYGNLPVVYFFPEAALSTLRGYKAYQYEDGSPPWIFGGMTARLPEHSAPYDLGTPDRGYQTVLNSACYIEMADRYWQRTGDNAMLAEFYDSLRRANDYSMTLRPAYGDSQVMAMPTPGTDPGFLGDTEWFEAPEPGWKGYVTHAGGVRMAQVAIMRRMAQAMGDSAYAAKCDAWLRAGAQAL